MDEPDFLCGACTHVEQHAKRIVKGRASLPSSASDVAIPHVIYLSLYAYRTVFGVLVCNIASTFSLFCRTAESRDGRSGSEGGGGVGGPRERPGPD